MHRNATAHHGTIEAEPKESERAHIIHNYGAQAYVYIPPTKRESDMKHTGHPVGERRNTSTIEEVENVLQVCCTLIRRAG